MVGENPQAAEGQGVSVLAVQRRHRGGLGGDGGGRRSRCRLNAFYFNMVNGCALIRVALVVFASWRPGKHPAGRAAVCLRRPAVAAAAVGDALLPYQMYLMLSPYLLSILALVLVARKASYPQALMKPYRKGER